MRFSPFLAADTDPGLHWLDPVASALQALLETLTKYAALKARHNNGKR
jgi:hypothetical protein